MIRMECTNMQLNRKLICILYKAAVSKVERCRAARLAIQSTTKGEEQAKNFEKLVKNRGRTKIGCNPR